MVDCHLGRQCGIDHTHPRQKKVEMLAVKIHQANARSIYFLDFVFGFFRADCWFYYINSGSNPESRPMRSNSSEEPRWVQKEPIKNRPRKNERDVSHGFMDAI